MGEPRGARVRLPFMAAFQSPTRDKNVRPRSEDAEGAGRGEIVDGRGVRRSALISEGDLKRAVEADLTTLLNTINMASTQRLDAYPQVARSILNYGIPDIAHRTIDEEGVEDIVGEIETAIRTYEPRIPQRSIAVRRETNVDAGDLRVRFRVAAEVRMSPENLPIEFIADVEVDSGRIALKRV